jgi:drug/metabolite transporter (DMT)-like permease
MFKKRITLKLLLILISTDFLETFTQFCFKKSALFGSRVEIGDFIGFLAFLKTAAFSPFLWMAFLSVLLTFIIWATVLSKIDLSVAVPVASFSYILVPVTSIVFLHEKISLLHWAGILFILAGVIIVSLSTHEKEIILP